MAWIKPTDIPQDIYIDELGLKPITLKNLQSYGIEFAHEYFAKPGLYQPYSTRRHNSPQFIGFGNTQQEDFMRCLERKLAQ